MDYQLMCPAINTSAYPDFCCTSNVDQYRKPFPIRLCVSHCDTVPQSRYTVNQGFQLPGNREEECEGIKAVH